MHALGPMGQVCEPQRPAVAEAASAAEAGAADSPIRLTSALLGRVSVVLITLAAGPVFAAFPRSLVLSLSRFRRPDFPPCPSLRFSPPLVSPGQLSPRQQQTTTTTTSITATPVVYQPRQTHSDRCHARPAVLCPEMQGRGARAAVPAHLHRRLHHHCRFDQRRHEWRTDQVLLRTGMLLSLARAAGDSWRRFPYSILMLNLQ